MTATPPTPTPAPTPPRKGDLVSFRHPKRGHRLGVVLVARTQKGKVRVRWPVGVERGNLIELEPGACTVVPWPSAKGSQP